MKEKIKSFWSNVTDKIKSLFREDLKVYFSEYYTTKYNLDTQMSKLHYTKLPAINLIVLDFDIPGLNGEKDLEANIREATKFPPTYAEVSKSGGGLHLGMASQYSRR